MMTRLILALTLFWLSPALAAEVTDATGRTVSIPDHIQHVLPAGPPAAVLLAAIAPGQLIGFTGPVSAAAKADLATSASGLPTVPRLTGPPPDWAAG
jgi:iron complex transport system substrate-binding protein